MLEPLEDRFVPAAVPAFTRVPISTTADAAAAVATADLDDDGDLDVLSAARLGSFSWYENNGGAFPTFTPHTIAVNEFGANSVATADIDGDGDFDLVTATINSSLVAWYENDGAAVPTFSQHTITTSALFVRTADVADLDDDGDMDVVSASFGDNKIAWYENDGAAEPTFTLRTISTSATGASSASVADVDGDDDLDILATFGGAIAYYENDGATLPTFTFRTISPFINSASAATGADVDDDGDTDLLSTFGGLAAWYENDGASSPTFLLHTIAATIPVNGLVSGADLDDDGDLDLLAQSAEFDSIVWYENDGRADPTFSPHTISTSADGVIVAIAVDLDDDGAEDVLAASLLDDTIAWYPNGRTVLTATGAEVGPGEVRLFDAVSGTQLATFNAFDSAGYTGGVRVVLADVNADDIPDLIVASGVGLPGGTLVKVYDGLALRNGMVTQLFQFRPYGEAYLGELFLAAGDFNHDGRADIVTSNVATGPTVKLFDALAAANGDPVAELDSVQPFGTSYQGGARLAVGDVNGDGTVDLIAGQSRKGAKVRVFSGHDFATLLLKVNTSPLTTVAGGVFVAAGDCDNDNRIDIVVGLGSGVKSKVFVYEDAGNNDTKATRLAKSGPLYGTTFKGGVRVATVDLDGDGTDEVLVTAGAGLDSYRLRILNGLTLAALDGFFSQAIDFLNARFVAAARLG